MRAAGTPPVHIAGRGQDGGLQLHGGMVKSRPSPFRHPLSIPYRLQDADAPGNSNDLSDKPSSEPGQPQIRSGLLNSKLINLALLIASALFSLFALELGLRAYVGLVNYRDGWTYQFMNFRNHWIASVKSVNPAAFDPELGLVPKRGVWQDDNITILEDRIRSNGGGEVPDSTEAILAVGDSFTFGDQVSDPETWPAQLEKLSGWRVINSGVFGYGVDQAFLRARRLLSRYRFNAVIFSFIPDDIDRCRMSERAKRTIMPG